MSTPPKGRLDPEDLDGSLNAPDPSAEDPHTEWVYDTMDEPTTEGDDETADAG